MISTLTATLLLLVASPDIRQSIQRLQPRLTDAQVQDLTHVVGAASREYAIQPMLLLAVLRLESGMQSGLRRCGIATWFRKGTLRRRHTCDYGLAQINDTWIRKWGLDPARLQYDDGYNVMIAARILHLFKVGYRQHEPRDWFGRYHSCTPSLRAAYVQKLRPFLALR